MKLKLKTQDKTDAASIEGLQFSGRVKHRHWKKKRVTMRTPSIESNHASIVAVATAIECDPTTGAPSSSRVAGICVSEASIVIGNREEQEGMCNMSEAACQTEFDDSLENVAVDYTSEVYDPGINMELTHNGHDHAFNQRNDPSIKRTPDYCETVATAF